jgi:hypothetical protein
MGTLTKKVEVVRCLVDTPLAQRQRDRMNGMIRAAVAFKEPSAASPRCTISLIIVIASHDDFAEAED